ncbi:MAG: caspase family protein [Acidobacteria bacterium]|nr:caspase family protein [Acidobacteriota bacterium]
MPNRIYALLVGINDYGTPIRKLAGCLNDVDRLHGYLQHHVQGQELVAEVLKDAQATRAGIIDGFRTHLGQAGPGDVALFQFCGHGARWASNAAFREFYPEGKDEGLVCFDSRPNGYDLADKELAVLIEEVASGGAQTAILLDCCHSGSGTRGADAFRGLTPRLTDEVTTERPLDTYLDGHFTRLRDARQPLVIPTGRHILLAACERGQLAQESADQSGVFTSTLVEVLERSGGALSYADVFVRCRAAVRSRAFDQDPQFEAYEHFDARTGFLGRDVVRTPRRYAAWFDLGAWTVDCGAIHGVPAGPDSQVALALYREDDAARPVGTATVVRVGAQHSDIALDFASEESARYLAEITSLPSAPTLVAFAGDDDTRAAVQETLDQDSTVRVSLVGANEPSQYRLTAGEGRLSLAQVGREPDIGFVELAGGGTYERAAASLLPTLRHVMEWERLLALQNPRTKMDTSKVEVVLEEETDAGGTLAHEGAHATLYCTRTGSQWRHIKCRFKVRNRTAQPLHLLLAYFSTAYGVHIQKNEEIPAGDAWMTLWGDAPLEYFYLDEGIDESYERFTLIASTERIDDFLLAQDDLEFGRPLDTRGIASVMPPRDVLHRNEWFARPCTIRVVRQTDQVGPADTRVARGQILVKGHPAVTARVSMGAARPAGRGVGTAADFGTAFEARGLTLVNFAGTRGGDDLSVLELTDIQNAASLKDNPLEIAVSVPLAEDEGLLPVVYDGQHVLLGGAPRKEADGTLCLSIDRIPERAETERGLSDSLKLYFFKTVLRHDNVNQLRWVDYRANGTVRHQASGVADKVAAARRVLLLVHGIIGDTEGMAAGVKACGLDRQFDLVLTYDYENLSTKIEDTARHLKAQLADAGLHDRDDTHLTLLVHSMGGLVSRWFIEREGGHRLVDHLVMCGTPNNGSPFGRIDDARRILTMLTGLALNYAPALIPFSSAVLLLLNRSKSLTPTLEQMHPASDFIRTLNESDDPGIPYTILAGDVAAYEEPSDALFARMVAKTGQSVAFDLLFANQANDIAVGVESILGIHGNRQTPPLRKNVACHHLNYFLSAPGQQALTSVRWSGGA